MDEKKHRILFYSAALPAETEKFSFLEITADTMEDIQNRRDIELLVDKFYKEIITDDLIGHFFTRVVEVDLEKHMPVMYDFWETTLLGQAKYKGNPMLKHIALNEKEPIQVAHFERWLSRWEATVRENFAGTRAEQAIKTARQIGELMKFKLQQHTAWHKKQG